MSSDVFLSHNSVDKPIVRRIAEDLERDGITTWLDESDLTPGKPWQEELEKALTSTRSIAVFMGAAGLGRWEQPEMRAGLAESVKRGVSVIPVLLQGAPDPGDLPLFLRAYTCVDLRVGINEPGLYRLRCGIRQVSPRVGQTRLGDAIIAGNDADLIVVRTSRLVSNGHAASDQNPYMGVSAFHEEDAERFFGRVEQVHELWNRFRDLHDGSPTEKAPYRLLPVYGPSGSGKSSVARAGLIPELARQPLPGFKTARVAVVTPGAHPLEALGAVLARVATEDATPVAKTREFTKELKTINDEGIFDGLRRIAEVLPDIASSPLIVLVDQFEEVYSLCDSKEEREAFIQTLLNATIDPGRRVSAIITLRSDFLGETQDSPDLNTAISNQGFLVPAMTEDQLRSAITQPAKKAGRELDDATVDLLIGETTGRVGALPLLQFALTRIWEGLVKGISPAETLKKIGGVGGSLAGEAQRIYDALNAHDQTIARQLFLELIQPGEGTRDTRRRINVEGLVPVGTTREHVQHVIQAFCRPGGRLITLSATDDGHDTAEVTHEALIDRWPSLRDWLTKERDDIRFQRKLEEATRNWEEKGRQFGSLWRPPDLNLLKNFHKRSLSGATSLRLTELQMAFFRKSERALWIQRTVVGAIPVLVIIVLAILWQNAQTTAVLNESLAETRQQLLDEETDRAVVAESLATEQRTRAEDAERFAQLQEELRRSETDAKQNAEHQLLISLLVHGRTYVQEGKFGRAKEDFETLRRNAGTEARPSFVELLGWWEYYRATQPPILSTRLQKLEDLQIEILATTDGVKVLTPSNDGKSVTLQNMFNSESNVTFDEIEGGVNMVKIVDDQRFLTAGSGSDITLWDLSTSSPIRTFSDAKSYLRGIDVAIEADLVAAVDGSGHIAIWNLGTGELIDSADDPNRKPLSDDLPDLIVGTIEKILLAPSGESVVLGHEGGRVSLWTVKPLKQIAESKLHDADIAAMRFDEKGLLTADDLGAINLSTIPELTLIESRQKAIKKPESWETPEPRTLWNQVLAPVPAKTVHAWQFGRQFLRPVTGETVGVSASQDGRFTLTTTNVIPAKMKTAWGYAIEEEGKSAENQDKLKRIIAAEDPKELAGKIGDTWLISLLNDEEGEDARALAKNLLARILEANDGNATLEVWPNVERELRQAPWDTLNEVALSPDGRFAYLSQYNRNVVRVFDTATHLPVASLVGHRGRITAIAASPTGRIVASGNEIGEVILWNTGDLKELARFQYKDHAVNSLCFSTEGSHIAVALSDGVLSVRETKAFAETAKAKIEETSGLALAWVPNQQAIGVGCGNGDVGIWKFTNNAEIRLVKGHSEQVTSIAASPNGSTVASGGYDGTICLWDAATAEKLADFPKFHAQVGGLIYSFDGRTLFSAGWANSSGAEALLWDVSLRTLLADYRMEDRIDKFVASADGLTFLSEGGAHKSVSMIWDLQRGTAYRRFEEILAKRDQTNRIQPALPPSELARWYAFRGLNQEAVAEARIARQAGELPPGQLWLAQAALAAGDRETGDAELANCRSSASSSSEETYVDSWISHFKRQDKLAELAKQLNTEPETRKLLLEYALLLHVDGQLEEAIAAYTKDIELEDRDPIVFASRAKSYEANQNYEGALADFDTARTLGLTQVPELGRNYAFAFAERANKFFDEGDYENALKDFDEAIARYSGRWSWFEKRGLSHSRLASAPGNSFSRVELLRMYALANQDMEKVIELDPKPSGEALKGGGIMISNLPEGIPGLAYYNIACNESLRSQLFPEGSAERAEDMKRAIDHLRMALKNGFAKVLEDSSFKGKSLREAFESDTDLIPLHDLPDFKSLLSEL